MAVEVAPSDSMRGLNVEAMFIGGSELVPEPEPEGVRGATGTEEWERSDPSASAVAAAEDNNDQLGADDFELSYSDGSTAPVDPRRRSLIRRCSRSQESVDEVRLAQALEETTADVWSAHRDESWPTGGADAGTAAAEPLAAAPQTRHPVGGSRGPAVLALVTVLAVILAAGGLVALNQSGTQEPKASLTTHTVTQIVTTPVTATRLATDRRKQVRQDKKAHKRTVRHASATAIVATTTTTTTTATATTTATYTTPATTTPAVNTERTTSTATEIAQPKTTVSKTSMGSGTAAVNCAQAMKGYQSGDLPTPAQAACAP